VPVEPENHERRRTIQGGESESGPGLCVEEGQVQWPETRRTRRNRSRASREEEGASQGLERMSCEIQHEIRDGFEPGCGIALALVLDGKDGQIEGCEASSPCPSLFCCGGSLRYGRPLLSRTFDCEH
jgi:hypothetical protein